MKLKLLIFPIVVALSAGAYFTGHDLSSPPDAFAYNLSAILVMAFFMLVQSYRIDELKSEIDRMDDNVFTIDSSLTDNIRNLEIIAVKLNNHSKTSTTQINNVLDYTTKRLNHLTETLKDSVIGSPEKMAEYAALLHTIDKDLELLMDHLNLEIVRREDQEFPEDKIVSTKPVTKRRGRK